MTRRDRNLLEALLLGKDRHVYGEYACVVRSEGSTACTLSVGSDPCSPSLRSKGSRRQPNEDALFARDDGERCLLAVADAHFGLASSHALMAALAESAETPRTPGELADTLAALNRRATASRPDPSATTLLIAVYDRSLGGGFGVSFGDSSLVVVSPAGGARQINQKDHCYVALGDALAPGGEIDRCFTFTAEPGSLLLVFTDGINECHYGHPETSLGLMQVEMLFARVGPHPEPFARRLTDWALAGLDGNPGGQDNIALIVTRC